MNKSEFIKVPIYATAGAVIMKYFDNKKLTKLTKESTPYPIHLEAGFYLLNRWLQIKNAGKTLEKYFTDNRIEHVAIYGMGALGERLYEELKLCNISVKYGIDRKADSLKVPDLNLIKPEEQMENVDVIIITPIQSYEAIRDLLEDKTDIITISLEDIIDYCLESI